MMRKILLGLFFGLSIMSAKAQVSKVTEFINTLPKNKEAVQVYKFDKTNFKDLEQLKGEKYFSLIELFGDSAMNAINELNICYLESSEVNTIKSLKEVLEKAGLKTLYSLEKDHAVINFLGSSLSEKALNEEILLDIRSDDNSMLVIAIKPNKK